jgi:uncharacterized protein
MKPWGFYGRREQLSELSVMIGRKRWFFAKIIGRRRIGKTTLIQQALQATGVRLVYYVQIPDSDAAGVLSAVNDALDTFTISKERFPRPRNLAELAKLIEALAEDGYVIVLDEFQYFNRKGFEQFCSYLQAVVDRLAAKANAVSEGLIVLGSIHTEMAALLEDRTAPLYNRVTHVYELTHLDIGSVLAILRDHADESPERLLFLWTLFEGVPKFYRDCHEEGVLDKDRTALLRRIFFESSSPLRTEAQNWFLRELRGRYDVVLKFVARQQGRMHNELVNAIREASGDDTKQIGGYLKILTEKYRLIERQMPIFAKPNARQGRYYLTDNFLCAWLAALANPVSAVAFRPLDQLVAEADERLAEVEGGALEKLAAHLYEERSRKDLGDFPLTDRIRGYWDKRDTEIDVVALNETKKIIRFGSCKRSPNKLLSDVSTLKNHVERFLNAFPFYRKWQIEYMGISPRLSGTERAVLRRNGIIPQDLVELTKGLE